MKNAASQSPEMKGSEARQAWCVKITGAPRGDPAQDADFTRKLLARWIARNERRAHGAVNNLAPEIVAAVANR